MVALYVALIINSRRTFEQVPAKFKEAVKADLEAIGLDETAIRHNNEEVTAHGRVASNGHYDCMLSDRVIRFLGIHNATRGS